MRDDEASPEPAALTDAQREYIVRRLAAFERPARIRRALRARFGITLSQAAIRDCDPTRNAACAGPWAELFHSVRRAEIARQSEAAAPRRETERLVLRIVAILFDAVRHGVAAQMHGTDDGATGAAQRLRALVAFARALKINRRPGVAEVRRALLHDRAPQGRGP